MVVRRLNEAKEYSDVYAELDRRFKPDKTMPLIKDGIPSMVYHTTSQDGEYVSDLYLGIANLHYDEEIAKVYLDIDVPVGIRDLSSDKIGYKEFYTDYNSLSDAVDLLNTLIDLVSPDMSDEEFNSLMDEFGFEHYLRGNNGVWY